MYHDTIVTAPAFVSLLDLRKILSGSVYSRKIHQKKFRRVQFAVTVTDLETDKINSYHLTVIRKSTGIEITELVCESEEHTHTSTDSFSLHEFDQEVNLRGRTHGNGQVLEINVGSFTLQ